MQRGEDFRGFRFVGQRGHDMIALAAILGQALQLQLPPAEGAADRAGGEDRGLHPLRWDRHVGQGEQASAAPEARLGPVEPEAMFAQQRSSKAGADAK